MSEPSAPHDHIADAEAEALKALAEGRVPLEPDEDDAPVEQAAAPDTPAPEATESPAPAEDEDFIPRADLESLLEGLDDEARDRVATAYKSFQRSATKRNQEVSGLLKSFEGIDPQAAREAFEFVEALKSDRNFATQVHQELAEALEMEGATPAQAQKQATKIVEDINPAQLAEWGIDPDNPLVAELKEMREFREQMLTQREQDAAERQREAMFREIERQDNQLRATRFDANADKADVDAEMDAIYRLATAFGGDLTEAAEYYDSLQDSWLTNYTVQKQNVPKGIEPLPQGNSYSEVPVEITDMKSAHQEALRRIKDGRYS
jgi:hypothetical protein